MRIAPALAALLMFSSFTALPVAPSFAATPKTGTEAPQLSVGERLKAANAGESEESVAGILRQEFRPFSTKKKAKAPKASAKAALEYKAERLIKSLQASNPRFAYKVLMDLIGVLNSAKGNAKTKKAYKSIASDLKYTFRDLIKTKGVVYKGSNNDDNQDVNPEGGNNNDNPFANDENDDEDVQENPNDLSPNKV